MKLKLFGKNTIVYVIGNVILRGAAFLLIPLYTHSLSVSDYGLMSTLLVTIQIVLIIMSLGMRTTLIRFAREYEQKNQLGQLLATSLIINVLGGVFVTGVILIFILPLFRAILHHDNITMYLLLTCFASFIQSLFMHMTSYYRAKNQAVKFMYASVAAAIILIIINILFLYVLHLGIIGALIAQIISYGIVLLWISGLILIKTGFTVSAPLILKLFRFGFPLVFSMSGEFFMGAATTYILSFFAGLETVAIYSLGYRLAQILGIVLIGPFQLAFQPFIFAHLDRPEIKGTMSRLFTYLVLATVFISFLILICTKALLPVIAPPEYARAYPLIIFIIPALAFGGVTFFGESLLNIAHKTHIIGLTVTISSIISIFLNFILIPKFGAYGAIITLYAANVSMSIFLLRLGLDRFPILLEFRRIGIIAFLMILFLSTILLLQKISGFWFYCITLNFTILSVFFMYSVEFFNELEKSAIKNFFRFIQLKLLKVS